jgi:translation initiation factor IF-2
MRDWTGKMLDAAPPGTPVKILGFKIAPTIGDILEATDDAKGLTAVKQKVTRQTVENFTATKAQQTEEEAKEKKMLNVVLRTDVLGSLEAILGMLEKVRHELVGVTVIQKGLGNITENDVERAMNSQPSVVYGFNVVALSKVENISRDKGVEIKLYKVIYDLFNDVVERLNALLPQEVIVTDQGKAEVAAIFRTEPGRMVVGVKVKEGKLLSGAKVRVWRGEEPIGEGVFETLQSGKSPVKELAAGQEGGTAFKGKVKLQPGDRFDCYTEESKTRKIEIPR